MLQLRLCVFALAHSDSQILVVNIYGKYLLLLAFAAVYFLSAVESHAEKHCINDHI